MEYRNFKDLEKAGLRVQSGINTRNKERVVSYEMPVKLNDGPMLLLRDIKIGKYTYARTGTMRHIKSIGRYCSIGPDVTIGEAEHPIDWLSTNSMQYLDSVFSFHPATKARGVAHVVKTSPDNYKGPKELCEIGNDVWIGARAQIRRGVKIGDGAIIAGGAFVNADVEPYTIVGGLPAKPIRKRFDDATIERLLRVKWWRFDMLDMVGIDFSDIHKALDKIEEMDSLGILQEVPVKYRKARVTNAGWQSIEKPSTDVSGAA